MKYTFDNISGNTNIVNSLKNSIVKDKVCHAYLFCGSTGIGKKLIANTFAKTLLCETGKSSPCNDCISCSTFENHTHPDVIYVRTEKKSIGVDDVRDKILKEMETKPYHYKYKIFIVEDADLMTIQAQNSILKTIEEPSSYGIFLLLSKSEYSLLPTILSRTVKFKLKPLDPNIVYEYLLQNVQHLNEKDAFYYALFSNGTIGYAEKLTANPLFDNMRGVIISLLIKLDEYDLSTIFKKCKELEDFKDLSDELLELMNLWFRDLLVYTSTQNEHLILQKNLTDQIIAKSEKSSIPSVVKNFQYIRNAKEELGRYANFQMVMEVLLLNLKQKV